MEGEYVERAGWLEWTELCCPMST